MLDEHSINRIRRRVRAQKLMRVCVSMQHRGVSEADWSRFMKMLGAIGDDFLTLC